MVMGFRRGVIGISLFAFLALATMPPSYAGIIGTDRAMQASAHSAALARVDTVLQRAEVQQRLTALGVDPQAALDRAAALTPAELENFAARLEAAPAGGDVLALVGAVFIVLLILELTGVIDIFKKT